YLALEEPQDGWGEYFRTPETSPLGNYVFPAVAKSFEIGGTANYPGAVALGESLKLTNELGIQIVEEQVRRLTDLLHFELARIGAHVVTDPDPCVRSG
ncbi:MAG: aminotransferase class V-fold PLP-dependent enzyme, partial [Anaerolineae bacterium]|nr:aminotransferase class V-fold PLP-dependent enzyme [Anaerolineae bacterium]